MSSKIKNHTHRSIQTFDRTQKTTENEAKTKTRKGSVSTSESKPVRNLSEALGKAPKSAIRADGRIWPSKNQNRVYVAGPLFNGHERGRMEETLPESSKRQAMRPSCPIGTASSLRF